MKNDQPFHCSNFSIGSIQKFYHHLFFQNDIIHSGMTKTIFHVQVVLDLQKSGSTHD